MAKARKTSARKRPTKRAKKASRKNLKPASIAQTPQVLNALKLGVYYPDYGGAFHGLVRGDEGKPDYWIFSTTKNQNAGGTFDENAEYAKNLKVGQYNDYHMPNRREQQIQMANAAPGQFEKAWYWSGEQYADDSGYAWFQHFGLGTQGHWLKVIKSRGCAVRRMPIR
jgi:hypothetical protein